MTAKKQELLMKEKQDAVVEWMDLAEIEGLSLKDAANQLGYKVSQLNYWRQRFKADTSIPVKSISEEAQSRIVEKFCKLREEGRSLRSGALLVGVPEAILFQWLKEHGCGQELNYLPKSDGEIGRKLNWNSHLGNSIATTVLNAIKFLGQ